MHHNNPQNLERNASTPVMRSHSESDDHVRPYTWDPSKFAQVDGFYIVVTRYRVTGVTCRSETCDLAFEPELLRFILKGKNAETTIIEYSAIRHIDYQEVPKKELRPEDQMHYPHLRDGEAECFGGPAAYIKLPEGDKLAEIRHGYNFELNVLYISGSPEDLQRLKLLIDKLGSPENMPKFATNVRYDRWVHKAFVEMLGSDQKKTLNFRDFKVILADHLNITQTDKLRDWFNEFSDLKTATMSQDQLRLFFHTLMFDATFVAAVILKDLEYSKQGLNVDQFKHFQKAIQKQEMSTEKRQFVLEKRVAGRKFSKRDKVSVQDFYTFLFSRENDILDGKKKDSMAYSLTEYWINSSHNTYLMGHQITGISSVETYIRVLLQGCRCIELDCIDGPDNDPIVWHKNTFCTKIRLFDVLKAINRFAFVSTPYPVVLSIENHLCIDQQIIMASMMTVVFKKKLVQYDLYPEDTNLPSPENLQNKILVKNKKINDSEVDDVDDVDENDEELNGTNSVFIGMQQAEQQSKDAKRFKVYLNDSIEGALYTYSQMAVQGCFLYVKEVRDRLSQSMEMRQHGCNSWYFGAINREVAEEIIKDFIQTRYLNNNLDQSVAAGSFLVRRSGTPLTGHYNIAVSYWLNNSIKHVRVKSEPNPQNPAKAQFFLDINNKFDSVPEFINHYHARQNPQFKFPVPNPEHYLNKLWYKGRMERAAAERLLQSPPAMTGKFLVRDRIVNNARVGFTVSFLAEKQDSASGLGPQHITAKELGPYVMISDALKFWSINHLVDHFTNHPINVGGVKLTMICSDGIRTSSVEKEPLTVELIEAYPYEGQGIKMVLLKGFKFLNAVRTRSEDGKWYYDAAFGTRDNVRLPEALVTVLKDQNPFGNNYKQKILLEQQTPKIVHNSEFLKFNTPISQVTIKFNNHQDVIQFAELFKKSAKDVDTSEGSAKKGLSKELSDLVVYCQAVKVPKPFTPVKIDAMESYQMCSFTELTIDKFTKNRCDYMNLTRFSNNQLARMYPKGTRIDSSNYSPMLPWAYGMQLVALNFQTPDLSMQLNHGMFSRNLCRGLIRKPQFLRKDGYDPRNLKAYSSFSDPVTLTIKLLTGRLISLPKHWNRNGCYVSVSLHSLDSETKKSTIDRKTSISPKWYQDQAANTMELNVGFPQLAILQFCLYSTNSELLGQRCVPVDYIKEGYRSVILHNIFGEELELAALLVHITSRPWQRDDRCSKLEMDSHRETELQKKASDLQSVIHSTIKYERATSMQQLHEQQATLEGYLSELFTLKYDDLINKLMNPLSVS